MMVKVLELLRKARLAKMGHVFLGGAEVNVSASKPQAILPWKDGRMKKKRERLEDEVGG